ncbi:GNAT family N-acetyltransferase [Paenibacillus sp. An7]|uniref:GNAT family N-acetyltransferase n=1 Tax=Paenibacillus sp. An7 TaxID=2689577 RepID=UPI0019175CA5|nr:GNAT family N-acetyltransferase [Paenibacillus sp. An7]
MMIELRKITFDNFNECISLRVEEDQQRFLATNIYTLAELYVVRTNNSSFIPMPYAVYHNDTMVGFITMSYVISQMNQNENYYDIYRFMIDKEYQQNGYGKEAIVRAIELIKTFPHGDASKIVIVYGEENRIARNLYTSLGFIENGERDEDGDILAEYVL